MKKDTLSISINPRDAGLVVAIIISVTIAIFIVIWAQGPDYRPLVRDVRLVDSVKIADVLDQNKIRYHTDIHSHMIYVTTERTVEARIALAKAGIEIDYPKITPTEEHDLIRICSNFIEDIASKPERPLWEQPWAMRALKLIMGGLIIIVFILSIVRPLIRSLFFPELYDKSDDE